jgi:hypothetical protein
MGTILVAVLAMTIAAFAVAMPRASHHETEMAQHIHAGVGDHDHDHAGVAQFFVASENISNSKACNDHTSAPFDQDDQGCCSMGACHAFQVSEQSTLHMPAFAAVPMVAAGDEQVTNVVPGPLDRPPRNV